MIAAATLGEAARIVATTTSAPDGTFRLTVAPGLTLEVTAHASRWCSTRASASPGDPPLELRLGIGGTLRVRASRDGEPVGDAQVLVDTVPPMPLGPLPFRMPPPTESDGTALLGPLPPGQVRVTVGQTMVTAIIREGVEETVFVVLP